MMSMNDLPEKVVSTTVEALRSVPLAIALLVVNMSFLVFVAYVLSQIASNAAERNKTQNTLIETLVKDLTNCKVRTQ